MENASKALLMAGGVMLTMLVISLLLYAWTSVSEYQANQEKIIEIQELSEFNQQFTNYYRDDVQGYELLSLVNKVIDYNQRQSSAADSNKAAGNSAQYKPITINIRMHYGNSHNGEDGYVSEDELTEKLATVIEIPGKIGGASKSYPNNGKKKLQLFTEPIYEQNNTNNRFGTILTEIHDMEKNDFGGPTGAQNLTKSIYTIFKSKIINYNGIPPEGEEKDWYQKSYIEDRFKTLTGKDKDIDDIRDEPIITKVLQYYEYMELKKAEFKCTGVNYDDGGTNESNTGRVIGMDFEIKE